MQAIKVGYRKGDFAQIFLFIFSFLCFLILSGCRREDAYTGEATGPVVRLQGVYQIADDNQWVRDCRNDRIIPLRDTPDAELRQQCSLFDNPEGTGLWLDLEGQWAIGKDTVFLLRRIFRVERRIENNICR